MTTSAEHFPYEHHPLQAAAQASRSDRNSSLDALHALEAALAQPAPGRRHRWVDGVRAALVSLRATLDAQAAGDSEARSLLSEIAGDQPRLLPRIERLRRQHQALRDSLETILDELAADPDHLDVAELRDQVADLARRFRHHRAQEADLIYDAIAINLGTGA